MTRIAALVSLSLLCLVASVQCYGVKRNNPLAKFMEAQKSKRPSTFQNEVSSNEYSPVFIGSQEGLKEADKVESLPGQPDGATFEQYSGYVTVDPVAGRALFYYFAQSENSSSQPLVLWLGGEHGCSSFGTGAMMELGPYRVNSDGKTLSLNKYAWNNEANMLFLESPAGVGFSYSNTSSDYVTGDTKTAADSYTFLINWLERFPEYQTRDLFITGESYAGHYIPQLAQLILQNNKITNQTAINLKGIAIGNAYVDQLTHYQGSFNYLWSHALISDELYWGISANCNFSAVPNVTEACTTYVEQIDIGDIFPYDIYAPWCDFSSGSQSTSGFDPCTYSYIDTYLNTQLVQTSLHVTVPPKSWSSCNNNMTDQWTDSPATVLPVIKELMSSGISVWLYSGDTDAVASVTTTRYAIDYLTTSVKTPWYPWYTQAEVGGYAVGYENLTFVTVRGSGHFVPSYQPSRALALFSSFLAGELPPSGKN
ncbi:serine carboxypeptidase 1-like [Apium graveolens]|uniref:serine carboxypeptidase 1-like n=1 Tax=Apium graveolens TaxID=4045 RepID=UPI003D7A209C